MEKLFNEKQLINNPFQDPMGDDLHYGLEWWLDEFHKPGVPGSTIITDPEYYVLLWFHDAIGNVIECPYQSSNYKTRLASSAPDFGKANKFSTISAGYDVNANDTESEFGAPTWGYEARNALNLTPYVLDISMPEISPAGAEKIKTLFGETTAGSFSPYASDGSKQITLQVVDTEYSILDGIFYPWMKDINSPWWYRGDTAASENGTPYPMATLEIQRPRMRYVNFDDNPNGGKSRNDNDSNYIYYSYKFIGVKPTSYAGFEVNGAGPSNLLRNLTMTCDMCIVDLTGDITGSAAGSTNLGKQSSLVFANVPSISVSATIESSQNESDSEKARQAAEQAALDEARESELAIMEAAQQNQQDMNQQNNGDMPGKEEADSPDRGEETGETNAGADGEDLRDPNMSGDENQDQRENWENEDGYGAIGDGPSGGDEPSGSPDSETPDPNGDLSDRIAEEEAMDARAQEEEWRAEEEKGFFDKVGDTLSDVGSTIMDGAKTAGGWIADGADAALGLAGDAAKGAVGLASDIATGTLEATEKIASGALKAGGELASDTLKAAGGVLGSAGGVAKDALGAAGSLTSSVLGGVSSLLGGGNSAQSGSGQSGESSLGQSLGNLVNSTGGLIGSATKLTGEVASGIGTSAGSFLGTVGKGASDLLGGVFGGSSSSGTGTAAASGGSSSSSSDSSSGGLLSSLGSVLKSTTSLGSTAFGVVSNVAGSAVTQTGSLVKSALTGLSDGLKGDSQQKSSGTTSLLGGVLNKALSTASSFVGQTVGQAGNLLGGTLNKVASAVQTATTPPVSSGSSSGNKQKQKVDKATNQAASATKDVRKVGKMTTSLNNASKNIANGIGLVGDVASSVVKATGSTSGKIIGEFGGLVDRMFSSFGNKPTPVENYIDNVTKNTGSPLSTTQLAELSSGTMVA